jgi:uncharacterized protein YndB with AHSA1/START domain
MTLPSDRAIVFARSFGWPRQLLFEAWTRPERIRLWWGSAGSVLIVCDIDLRAGGAWRRVTRRWDGTTLPFKGVYREVVLNERLVYTECYDVPNVRIPEWTTTVILDEGIGATELTISIVHPSVESRDRHLHTAIEPGIIQSLNRLDQYLESDSSRGPVQCSPSG